jgi:hypothetical protein
LTKAFVTQLTRREAAQKRAKVYRAARIIGGGNGRGYVSRQELGSAMRDVLLDPNTASYLSPDDRPRQNAGRPGLTVISQNQQAGGSFGRYASRHY